MEATYPLTDEWIKKLIKKWYIHTMDFYSDIKRNTFESGLMRWMNLEPIIQSEVSQKEKNNYHMSLVFNTLICHSFSSKEQVSFNFRAIVTICSDFGAQENSLSLFPLFPPSICHEMMGPDAMILVFWMLSFKPAFSLSSFTFTKKLFSSSLLSALEILAFSWHPLPTTHIPLVKGVRWSRLSSVGLGNKLPTLLLSKSHGRGNEELRIHQPTLEVILWLWTCPLICRMGVLP